MNNKAMKQLNIGTIEQSNNWAMKQFNHSTIKQLNNFDIQLWKI